LKCERNSICAEVFSIFLLAPNLLPMVWVETVTQVFSFPAFIEKAPFVFVGRRCFYYAFKVA